MMKKYSVEIPISIACDIVLCDEKFGLPIIVVKARCLPSTIDIEWVKYWYINVEKKPPIKIWFFTRKTLYVIENKETEIKEINIEKYVNLTINKIFKTENTTDHISNDLFAKIIERMLDYVIDDKIELDEILKNELMILKNIKIAYVKQEDYY